MTPWGKPSERAWPCKRKKNPACCRRGLYSGEKKQKRHGRKILSRLKGGGNRGPPSGAEACARSLPPLCMAWTPGFEPAYCRGPVFVSVAVCVTGIYWSPAHERGFGEDGRTWERSRWLFSWPGEGTQRSRALPRRPTRFPGEDSPWERENLRKVDTLVLLAGSRGLGWQMCGEASAFPSLHSG